MEDKHKRALKVLLEKMLEKIDNGAEIQYRDIQTLINMNSRWEIPENKKEIKEDIER